MSRRSARLADANGLICGDERSRGTDPTPAARYQTAGFIILVPVAVFNARAHFIAYPAGRDASQPAREPTRWSAHSAPSCHERGRNPTRRPTSSGSLGTFVGSSLPAEDCPAQPDLTRRCFRRSGDQKPPPVRNPPPPPPPPKPPPPKPPPKPPPRPSPPKMSPRSPRPPLQTVPRPKPPEPNVGSERCGR